MPATLKKILLLSMALVLSLVPVALAGCSEMSQEEIDQIIAGAAAAEHDTAAFATDVTMTLEVVGGSDPGEVNAVVDSSGVVDDVNEALQMAMNMTLDVVGEGTEEITTEIYVVDGWMYNTMDIAGLGGEWLKVAITEEMWQQQSPVEQQIALLETAFYVKYRGTETVNGTLCYVLEIEPDMAEIGALLVQETSGVGFMDFGGLDVSDLYEEVSIKQWLAQDSYLPMKVEMEMVMEIDTDDLGAEGYDFDKMKIDIDMEMTFSDYNQPVSIVLPPEALEAEELTY